MLAKNPTEWRKIVLKQGNYACQKCGTEGTIADHIKPKNDSPELFLEIDNGRTLCRKCHSKYGAKTNRIKYDIGSSLLAGISKLQLVGGSLMISVPPWFIRRNNLHVGSRIGILANSAIIKIYILEKD